MVAEQLRQRAQDLIGQALAPTTKQAYHKVWCDLFSFMEVHLGVTPQLPVEPETIIMFVIYLNDSGSAVQTIKQKLSAVSYIHGLHKILDPCKDDRVKKVLKALAKDDVPREPKNPITIGLLDCILEVIHSVVSDAYQTHMYRAVLSLMYHACLRVGECVLSGKSDHAMNWGQVCFLRKLHEPQPGAYSIAFRTFKHRNGRRVPPIKVDADGTRYCPVNILWNFYNIRPKVDEYFFVHPDGTPVRGSEVAGVLAKAVARLGLDPKDYTPHSLRAGKITDIMAQGRSAESVRAVGRWRTAAQDVYNRPSFTLA